MRFPVILAVIGVVQLSQFLGQHGHHPGAVFASLAGSLLLAVAFAAIRAATVHVWVDDGQAWRQGTIVTAVLWILSLGMHLGFDFVVDGSGEYGLGAATLLLYLAVTYTVQRMIIVTRAKRVDTGEKLDPEAHMHVTWP